MNCKVILCSLRGDSLDLATGWTWNGTSSPWAIRRNGALTGENFITISLNNEHPSTILLSSRTVGPSYGEHWKTLRGWFPIYDCTFNMHFLVQHKIKV